MISLHVTFNVRGLQTQGCPRASTWLNLALSVSKYMYHNLNSPILPEPDHLQFFCRLAGVILKYRLQIKHFMHLLQEWFRRPILKYWIFMLNASLFIQRNPHKLCKSFHPYIVNTDGGIGNHAPWPSIFDVNKCFHFAQHLLSDPFNTISSKGTTHRSLHHWQTRRYFRHHKDDRDNNGITPVACEKNMLLTCRRQCRLCLPFYHGSRQPTSGHRHHRLPHHHQHLHRLWKVSRRLAAGVVVRRDVARPGNTFLFLKSSFMDITYSFKRVDLFVWLVLLKLTHKCQWRRNLALKTACLNVWGKRVFSSARGQCY